MLLFSLITASCSAQQPEGSGKSKERDASLTTAQVVIAGSAPYFPDSELIDRDPDELVLVMNCLDMSGDQHLTDCDTEEAIPIEGMMVVNYFVEDFGDSLLYMDVDITRADGSSRLMMGINNQFYASEGSVVELSKSGERVTICTRAVNTRMTEDGTEISRVDIFWKECDGGGINASRGVERLSW